MDISNNTNITGISKLLNYDGIKNVDDLEKLIIDDSESVGDDMEDNREDADVDNYRKQLSDLSNTLGVNLDEDYNEEKHSDVGSNYGGNSPSQKHSSMFSSNHTRNTNNDYDDNESSSGQHNQSYNQSRDNSNHLTQYTPRPHSYGERITEEQKKQRILKHVLGGIDDQKFSVEREKEEDDKAILLEQIDMLITNLKDEGVDVSRVPTVDHESPIEDIENVHKILRLKNDRNRYCSFAEECILAGSHTLEWLFDGDKSYLGKKPDLRGWSATVNIKLRRMRYDTSTFVSEVMQDYNLGHGTRIMFELLPSLFLYSKMKKSQYADNLITSDEMNSAIDRIRDIDEKSSSIR
jgi:hypothetical protein